MTTDVITASNVLAQCVVPNKLCSSADVSSYSKTIFALLTVYLEENPSLVWLAEHVPCSVPTVVRALYDLEAHGWIVKVQRNKAAGETNTYILYFDQLPLASRASWIQARMTVLEEIEA